ncbi:hypothetical protein [Amaricoccus sp.]|uniref:hypothetical protein n=1 Tax=Amaricoccus sp. TaxID=1872485 RepID=UPI002C9CC5A1|nr:hypothetical protein [Amaricoccus sp.]
MTTRSSASWSLWSVAAVAVVFGALTILSGGTVLFGGDAAREAAGKVVPFVLWFNFLSGFVYVLAGVAIALRPSWAASLSAGLAIAIALVFVAFGLHAALGGAFEPRTAIAMTLRLTVWIAIVSVLSKKLAARSSG